MSRRGANYGVTTIALATSTLSSSSSSPLSFDYSRRPFSVLNRPPPNYEGHVPLKRIERLGMAIGSGIGSFLDPYRGGKLPIPRLPPPPPRPDHASLIPFPPDLIAVFAETTSTPYFLPRLRDAMLRSPTGRRILRDRPRLTSASLDLPRLRTLAPTTVGRTYVGWLDREGVTPDTRAAVRYVDDEECAYVLQRYRECHDFYHALTGLPVVREGEVALKAFEWANTALPMTGLSMLSALTLDAAGRRRFVDTYLPWALRNGWRADEVINVYWEEELESDVEALRAKLGVERPPDLREIRKREREAKKRAKAAQEQKEAASTAA